MMIGEMQFILLTGLAVLGIFSLWDLFCQWLGPARRANMTVVLEGPPAAVRAQARLVQQQWPRCTVCQRPTHLQNPPKRV